MPYRFLNDRTDYSDYAGGRVFYSLAGQPAFPVRLVSETFQRCLALRRAAGLTTACSIFDPCCGGAYHLATLAYLHWGAIASITASDINPDVLDLARRNLSLLTPAGIDRRITEISRLFDQYQKPSHASALQSAARLRSNLLEFIQGHQVQTHIFAANAVIREEIRAGLQIDRFEDGKNPPDIVLTDVPYGWKTTWQSGDAVQDSDATPIWRLLESLSGLLGPLSLVAVAADKTQKIAHPAYNRRERFILGRRQVVILGLVP
jgi:SAM-dependent methyltransferase